MWIRTQSRQCLIKTDLIEISELRAIPIEIRGYQFDGEKYVLLGEYKTEAEALRVLDRIQEAIARMDDVFVMPESGFLKQ